MAQSSSLRPSGTGSKLSEPRQLTSSPARPGRTDTAKASTGGWLNHLIKKPIITPVVEITPHSRYWREIVWQHAPLATGRRDIEGRIKHIMFDDIVGLKLSDCSVTLRFENCIFGFQPASFCPRACHLAQKQNHSWHLLISKARGSHRENGAGRASGECQCAD